MGSFLAEQPPIILPHLFRFHDLSVGVAARPNQLRFFVELKQLVMRTHWVVTRDTPPILLPSWSSQNGSHQITHHWAPPPEVRLYFTAGLILIDGYWAWEADHAYLLARVQGRTGAFKPPLPNIFDDGRICMGRDVPVPERNSSTRPVFALVEDLLNHFYASTWNADLLNTIPEREVVSRALFGYNLDNKQLPIGPMTTWIRGFVGVSNNRYNDLPLEAP